MVLKKEKQDMGFTVSHVASEPIIPKYVSAIFDLGVIIILQEHIMCLEGKLEIIDDIYFELGRVYK